MNWIDDQYLKDSTLIQQNVDSYLFENDVDYVQRSRIQTCLSKEMVDRINSELDNPPLSTDIKDLLDNYIKKALALHTFYAALPNIWIRITNKGVYKKADNTNESVENKELEYIRRQYKSRAEWETSEMTKYIEENPEKYPEQESCQPCSQRKGFNFGMDYTTK